MLCLVRNIIILFKKLKLSFKNFLIKFAVIDKYYFYINISFWKYHYNPEHHS